MSPSAILPVAARPLSILVSCLGITLIAAAIRFIPLREPALWFDEAFSIFYVEKGLSAIWGADWRLEPTPPLYYSLLYFWTKLFGAAEPSLRALSLIASSCAAGVIFLSGRVLGGARAGWFAGLLWALVPLAIDYGIEIRAYAVEFFMISGLTLSFVSLIKGISEEKRDHAQLVRGLVPFVGFGLLASYTHITAILAFSAYLTILTSVAFLRRRDLLKPMMIASVIYGITLLPQIFATLAVMTHNQPTLAWLVRPSFMDAIAVARALLVGNMQWGDPQARPIILIWFAAGLLALFLLRRRPFQIAATLGVAALGFLVFFVFSRSQPILLNRTALWMMIPTVLFIGAGLARLPKWPSIVAFTLLAGGSAWAAHDSFEERQRQRGDERGIQEVMSDSATTGPIVTVDGELACEFVYFRPEAKSRLRLIDLGEMQEFHRTQRVDLSCNNPPKITLEELKNQPAAWLVGRTPFYENGGRIYRDTKRIRQALGESPETVRIENESFFALRVQRP